MNYGESFLSKLLDKGNTLPITEYGINENDFETKSEKRVYNFITSYAKENGGRTPDFRTVVEYEPDFYYREDESNTFAFMAKELKSNTARRMIVEMFNGNPNERGVKTGETVEEVVNNYDGNDAIKHLISELESIRMRTSVRNEVGTIVNKETQAYLDELKDRAAGKTLKIWRSKFPSMNKAIAGFFSGNMYTWFGRSGRGKSVFVMEEALESAMQGANVLIWAMEMSRFEFMSRVFASLSARKGVSNATIDGIDYEVGFENRSLLSGNITDDWLERFELFLAELNDFVPGNIILRAADDDDFMDRSTDALRSDIKRTEADVVVIDAIYHMDYEANTSRTAGGDAANTSKKLRAMAGQEKVVMHVITQAEEDTNDKKQEERELNPPSRSEVKSTKQVTMDCVNLFAIDSKDGGGMIRILKGRQGGEDSEIEVLYLPNYGLVKELEASEEYVKELLEVL